MCITFTVRVFRDLLSVPAVKEKKAKKKKLQKCVVKSLHSPIGDKTTQHNHYEKQFNLQVWCSMWLATQKPSITPSKKLDGTGFANDKSLHKILLFFVSFPVM